ncbi:hypothetical protein NU08_3596 [Flavobacterium anhuiense]|uniref:Uncharacterized protein n=1 Tax=Flavobacterium anhuiense TaxID=459526 RepID=A0A444VUU7_9FLAO|nr:hypothetical protein NU08_3596 [Flavobacterium anhuiense]
MFRRQKVYFLEFVLKTFHENERFFYENKQSIVLKMVF